MRERIAEELDKIEAQHGVRILYAAESGSRAWGFTSPDSDYDVRFIYARSPRDYVRIYPLRDVIELPLVDNLDINGWDILKALNLFRASNPPLLEWLFSPIIYRESGDFAGTLRALASEEYSAKRMTYHYLSMARRNFLESIANREEVSLKKYLYALRPLACIQWMERHDSPPPTSLERTLEGIELPVEAREHLADLIERKRNVDELGKSAPDAVLNAFIESEIERIGELVADLADERTTEDRLNALVWKELGL